MALNYLLFSGLSAVFEATHITAMGRAEHRRMHNRMKTKRKTKDVDQVEEDIKPENVNKLLNQPVDLDQTGSAQFYCIHCA